MLTIVKFSHTTNVTHKDRIRVKYFYECKCDCGNITIVNRQHLLQKLGKLTYSCGCYQKEQSKIGHEKQKGVARPHVQKPNGISVSHTMFLGYKAGANRRNINFDITEHEFETITTQNCFYCNQEPVEKKKNKSEHAVRKMNGIDRINSNVGYTVSNCVPCCKICNYMKQELSTSEFYDHLLKIVQFKSLGDNK